MSYFTITLCSDLCASNGESYGSTIDTDIAYDDFGIPVIRGKSLKGCLREAAEELADLGLLDESELDALFGKKGAAASGLLTIQDAHPVNYPELIRDIHEHGYSRERILGCYTQTRGQTKLNETGTAEKGTLRTIRVLKRGLTFLCEYTIAGEEDHSAALQNCLKLLRHIGMNRTRGLGEIRCQIPDAAENEGRSDAAEAVEYTDSEYFSYTFTLLSPLIPCKENEKLDHIPAAAMMGLCFEQLGRDFMLPALDEGLTFTNAFISDGNTAFYPNPAFLAKQKEAAYAKDAVSAESMPVYIFETEECRKADPPALPVKNMHIAADTGFTKPRSLSIMHEINYHHQQGEVGQISEFYQLSSLAAGQTFMGRIYGKPEQLAAIHQKLNALQTVNLGYYRSSGYGRCSLHVQKKEMPAVSETTDCIAVWLHSPAVLLDEVGMPCAKPDAFVRYLDSILPEHVQVKTVRQKHLRYTQIGGYNVTWGMHKQVLQAYAGGTVFVLELTGEADVQALQGRMLGERTAEGYGEMEVFAYHHLTAASKDGVSLTKADPVVPELRYPELDNTELKWELPSSIICKRMTVETAEGKGMEHCDDCMKKYPINPTQVGRLTLMVKESKDYEELCRAVDSICDEKRKEAAQYWTKLWDVEQKYYKEYLLALLMQAKFKLRGKRNADETK